MKCEIYFSSNVNPPESPDSPSLNDENAVVQGDFEEIGSTLSSDYKVSVINFYSNNFL